MYGDITFTQAVISNCHVRLACAKRRKQHWYLTHCNHIDRPRLVIFGNCLRSKQTSFLRRSSTCWHLTCRYESHYLCRIPMEFDRAFRTEVGSDQSTVCLEDSHTSGTVVCVNVSVRPEILKRSWRYHRLLFVLY